MVLASKASRDRGHHFIGGAHFGLALLETDTQAGTGLFERMGVDLAELKSALDAEAELEADGQIGHGAPEGSPPFTPRLKKALEMSLREALRLNQNWIGLGHMLLGAINAAASTTLVERLPLNRVREIVAAWEAEQPSSEQAPREGGNETIAKGFSEVMKSAMTAGTKPIGSHHLLLGMFEVENSLARKVLEALGVSKEKVAELVESMGTAGTIDAPAPRQVEIRAGGRAVIIGEDDLRSLMREGPKQPDLVDRLKGLLDKPDMPEDDH